MQPRTGCCRVRPPMPIEPAASLHSTFTSRVDCPGTLRRSACASWCATMNLLLTSTVLTAFLGGVVALLAPRCISMLLPAYFVSTIRCRTHIAGMTLVFATGVATVILPIALGARLIAAVLVEQHRLVFGVGGALMVLGGLAMLAGKSFRLPLPISGPTSGGGVLATHGLGVFSGGASAC